MSSVGTEEQQKAEQIEEWIKEANAARMEFIAASRAFNFLTEREADVLGKLMNATLRMQNAKVRIDTALHNIKTAAGFLP